MLGNRILAFLIDFLLILVYILVLLGTTLLLFRLTGSKPDGMGPVKGQLTGFFSLTLPVVLYFFFMENSNLRGSIGKLKAGLHIKVNGRHHGRRILKRNILKFLPWEMAHTGVYQVWQPGTENEHTPVWAMVLLLLSMFIEIVYAVSVFRSKGRDSLYDRIAGTSLSISTSNNA